MKKFFLLSALLMFLIFPAKVNSAANWVWIYSDSYETFWIDNNSIGRDSNGFFAYFKETYRDAGKNRIIEFLRSNGLSVNGYYDLSNSIWFIYFKNSGRTKYLTTMRYAYYSKNGTVLDSWSTNNFNWQRVIPSSYGETKYDAAYARVRGK